ncbi:MAG: PucR family transcriptional regulator ligand-binding domain-containing protein [Romboutsia sp.]
MVSCNDLLSLKIFENIKLVAGESDIYKTISWPYICQTLDFSEWVNGGEIMFLTGMGMDLNDKKIIELIYRCSKKGISGLVILTNSEYIKNISSNIKDVANKVGLPLFDMPWNIKLIDVNKEIASYIMQVKSNYNEEKEILSELLLSQDLDKQKIKNLINNSKLSLDKNVFVVNFSLIKDTNTEKISIEYLMNMVKSMISKYDLNSILGIYGNYITCVIEVNNKVDFTIQKSILVSIHKQLSKYANISLSIGSICENIFSIRQSYNDAKNSFKLYESNGWDLEIIDYDNLGFYKILFEVNNYEKLRNYCYSILGKVIESDKNANLLKTLRCYLENNCNLLNTSREMFIHRNTLIYRLDKIKTKLNSNLENPILKNELMNAIMIYDYLKCDKYNY